MFGFVSMEWILEPWPWYVSGPLIGFLVPAMLWLGSSFGVSGNLESICGIVGAGRISDYFKFDLSTRIPGLLFVTGAILGGFIASNFLSSEDYSVALSASAVESIKALGITDFRGLQPSELFNWEFLTTQKGLILLCLGGFLIGFGTRYAGGCTSGHSITGLSALRPASLIATIGFFIGGLITTHFILPIILGQ